MHETIQCTGISERAIRECSVAPGRGFRQRESGSPAVVLFLLLLLSSSSAAQDQPPGNLTLQQAVQFALQHSPELQNASAEVRRRSGVAKIARSPLLPQVDLLADASQYRLEHGIPPGRTRSSCPLITHCTARARKHASSSGTSARPRRSLPRRASG